MAHHFRICIFHVHTSARAEHYRARIRITRRVREKRLHSFLFCHLAEEEQSSSLH